MKTYTLEQINNIMNDRRYSKDRFVHLFSIFGYAGKEIEKFWEMYSAFPRVKDKDYETADLVIEKILEIPKIEIPWNIHHSPKDCKKRVYFPCARFKTPAFRRSAFSLNEGRVE